MIEQLILEYLTDVLDVPVYTIQPEDKENTYVILERTGGSRTDKVDTATIALQSYGQSMYQAAVLHETVMRAMEGLASLPEIGGVNYDTDYHFPDLVRKRDRYQVIYQITYYKEVYNA